MAERRAGAKGRRLGSSRRKQLREASGGSDNATAVAASVPGPEEESPWVADVAQKVQDFFRACDREQKGFVTRADLQELRMEDFPCSGEELELVFDGLDTDGNGRLTAEELTAGLRQFLSSQRATRDHRRRKTASRRDRLAPGGPSLEEADSEERKRFAAFVDQLGTDNSFADQEIWQLWVKLRQDEPQLLGNLEDFLAKMRRRIQEAKSEKEALEVILNKRVAEHNREVQQLCEALEQQMRQEMQQLEQESEARSHQHSTELWRALEARESEVQRLISAQTELETRCRSLRSTREATSTENRRLERSNRELEERLQRIHLQLRETQGRLWDARAAAAPGAGDGPAAELPGETPPSPQQTSPEKSEKYRSEMRISFGSQSGERPPKSGHHVVWEKVPAEITISGPLPRVISIEEDPFPEFLKEERFSDQSSLLREMNDAIAALSKEQKSQGPGDHVPAGDVPLRPREDATTHSAAPGAPRETLTGLHGQEPLQGDLLQEGPAQAALGARDVTPAGASESAGHRMAQERGGEQGENPGRAGQGPEDPRRIFFVQGQGTATAEQMLEEAEGLQGAQGESAEAGAQAEVEEAGLTQEKTGREAAQPPGDAEKAALTQGENSEADPGPAEPQELELALGGRFTAEVAAPAGDAAQGERVQPASEGAELGDGADSCVWRSKKLELELGEHLDPEVQSLGEAGRAGVAPGESAGAGLQPLAAGRAVEAGQAGSGDADGLDVSQTPQLAPAEGAAWPSEARTPGATQGHVLDAGRPLAQAQVQEVKQGESSDAEMQPPAKAAEGEVARSAEAELQPGGESAVGDAVLGGRGDAGLQPGDEAEQLDVAQGGSTGPALQPPEAEPLDVMQEEGAGADVQPGEEASSAGGLEGRSSDASAQSLAEAEELEFTPGESAQAELQPLSEAGSPDMKQGGMVVPHVQPPDEADKAKLGLQEGSVAAAASVHFESPSPAETLVGSSGPDVLLPSTAQGLEIVEAEEGEAEARLWGVPSAESLEGADGRAATPPQEEVVHGGLGEGERVLLHEPESDPCGVGVRAAADVQPGEEANSAGGLEGRSSDASAQSLAGAEELEFTPGESAQAELQPLSEASSPDMKQGGIVVPHVQPPDEADQTKLGLQEGSVAAAASVHFESPSPAETLVGSSGPDVLLPVMARGLEIVEAEEGETEARLWGVPSAENLEGAEGRAATPLQEEAVHGGFGEGERVLLHEPDSDPCGVGAGAAADVQPVEEAKSTGGLEGQSSDASAQSLAGAEELEFTPGESAQAELQPLSEAGSPDPLGVGVGPGEGAAAGPQPLEEAESLGAREALSPDVEVLPLAEAEEPKFTLSESMVADLGPLGAVQMQEGMPGQMVALEARVVPKGDVPDAAADTKVQPLAEAATQVVQPHDKATTDAETPDLEVMLGAFARADGQILEESQTLERTQGERADACSRPEEGARKLEVVQAEMIHPEFLPQALGALNGEKTRGKSAELEVYSLETPKAEVMQGDKASTDVLEQPKEAMLGESTDPALCSFKIHGVETLQGERTDAEVRPLDVAQDLEVVQGVSLEADERFLAQTEGLQLKQGRDAGAATLASPVSEVPLPIRGQKQETLMQEDVLVPDLQRLGVSGQEQVSTQADKVRPDVAPEQLLPKEKPLWVMETEQIAAERAEPPKEEVPPGSTLYASVRRKEHTGSDLAGTLLGDSLLRDVANSGVQPPGRLSEEPRNGLDVGQWDGKQDIGLKTSQEAKPSPEDPGAASADGAGTAPRGSAETWPDPDHLYNVLFVGDSHVGKTSFLYRLHANSFNPHLTATVGLDYQIKNLVVDDKLFALRLWDSAGQERYHSITKQFFRKADGVVLMYDITSEYSFADVRYWLSCIQEGAEDGVAILLLGNKTDCAAERRVPTKEGERLAQEHQLTFYECSAASGHNVSESMVSLIRLLKIREDQLKTKVEEEPKPTRKKRGCC